MLLTLDLGNSNLTAGVFAGRELKARWRISTRRDRTSDEWGLMIAQQVERRSVQKGDLEGVILASVVPSATTAICDGCLEFLGLEPLTVDVQHALGIEIAYSHPEELGADRIANAVGALERFEPPVIVVDFGTSTNFDAVDAKGRLLGGAIAPGITVSTEALFQRAALLRRVRLEAPERAIGRTTDESLQSGIVLGFAGQVDALVRRMQNELGRANVVATGGLAELIAPHTETIGQIDRDITLYGLRALYERWMEAKR